MNDRELFLYELEGRGYTFENMTWLGNCFEDDILNMAWEMWCASASREGYKLVPVDNGSSITRFSTQGIDVCSVSNTNP